MWRQSKDMLWNDQVRVVFQEASSVSERLLLKGHIETALELTQEKRQIRIFMADLPPMQDGSELLGLCHLGNTVIDLNNFLFGDIRYPSGHFMPAIRDTSTLLFVLMHELGHANDFRSPYRMKVQKNRCPCRQHLPATAQDDGWEAYADSYAEWYLTRGQTTNVAARWYARVNRWRFKW